MGYKINKANILLTLGLVGITAVLLTIISDVILLGRPVSAYSFFKLGTESMADIAQWRITVGTYGGVFVLPFQIAGLISLYYGLKPSGKVKPLVLLIINTHVLIMGVAFHVSYAFLGSGWKLYYQNNTDEKIVSGLVERFVFYWKLTIIIMLIEILLSSLIYARIILTGKTLYSKWMAILNPICVLAFAFPVILLLPAPIGGYLAPAYMNISTIVIFSFSMVVIYKKLKTEESGSKVSIQTPREDSSGPNK